MKVRFFRIRAETYTATIKFLLEIIDPGFQQFIQFLSKS